MTTQTLEEAMLSAPVFCGTDEEIAACTQSWASIVSALSYCNSQYICGAQTQMSAENKKALYVALCAYSQIKLDELNNVTVPPTVTTMNVTQPPAAPTAPTEVAFSAPVAAPEASYAESQEQDEAKKLAESKAAKSLQRMRELAGIPHAMNRV